MAAEHAQDALALDPRRLHEMLDDLRFGRRVEIHDSIGSTNDRAKSLGRGGAADGTVVAANHQTAGRGRRGRVWHSPAGAGLYVSVVLRSPAITAGYAAAVQLAAGVALAETLRPLVPRCPELLWPNDCLCDGAKIAGVLVEAESGAEGLDFLVCGIGVNVNQIESDFPSALMGAATSVRMLGGRVADRTELLGRLLQALDVWEDVARHRGTCGVIPRWEELAPSARGHEVELESVDGFVKGVSAGLGERGGLRVVSDGAEREVLLGELVRVRRKS